MIQEKRNKAGQTLMQLAISASIVLGTLAISGCCCGSGGHFAEAVDSVNVFFDKELYLAIEKVAILPFKAPTELIGSSVSDMFVTEILRSGSYTLVERSQISQVLGETELALAGVSSARAMEVGQMTGADAVVIGTVVEYEMIAYKGKKYPSVGVSVRLIDSKNGQIIWSADYAERGRDKGASLSQHARNIVHDICGALYKNGLREKKRN